MEHLKSEFLASILAKTPPLSLKQAEKAAEFAEFMHSENKSQNLTRIIGVEEFYEGHLLDVINLFKMESLGRSVLDIGSGCGVPGLLGAAIDTDQSRKWALIDSEQSKADYLKRGSEQLGLNISVSVYSDRVKHVIGQIKPDTVIARAVGTVDKIANWIWGCSTWNNLILFKSRGWDGEWSEAVKTRFGKKLTVTQTHEYSSGDKYRVLINLKRK